MKKILTILYSLAILLASSCTNDIDSLNAGGYGDAVNFRVSSDIVMRSVATQDEFVDGNTIGIYMDGNDGIMLSENVKYTVNSKGELDYTSGTKILYPTSGETATFYAFSPYPTVQSSAIGLNILTDSKELLVSNKPTGSQTSNDDIELTFTHTLAKIQISYTSTNEIPKLTSVYVVGSTQASCSIVDNTLTATASTKSKIDATITDNADGVTQDIEAIILPTNEDDTIEIYYNYTIGSDRYAKKSTLSTSKFESGYIYTYDLMLGDDYATLYAGNIVQWGSEDLSADTSTKYIGDGTKEYPWGIYTEADMKLIGTDGKRLLSHYYILMNNIELQDAWTPIGNSSTKFSGTFDGGGYEISGLSVSGDIQYAGLFGYSSGTISNLGVSGSVSSSYSSSSDSYVGGVVGHNTGTITNCYNSGGVSANNSNARVGGVVGYNSDSGAITNCYNSGTLSGTADCIGGVVGRNASSSTTTTNCYSSGEITGTATYIGGVAGRNIGTITNCYWNTTNYNGSGISAGIDNGTTGMTDTEMKDASFVITLNNNASELTSSGACAWVATATYPTLDFDGTPTYTETDIECKSEDGGENYAYYIYTVKGLHAFRDLVNGSGNSTSAGIKGFESSAFDSPNGSINGVLTKSIDLNSEAWTPIGYYNNPFEGTFDGGGYEIQNLYINSSTGEYQGLFGYIDGVYIKNLGVTGSITAYRNVGGIVGGSECNNSSLIINCYNKCNISASGSMVGGIIGYCNNYINVINCYNTGNVSLSNSNESQFVGGIAGYFSGYNIINCYSVGGVSVTYNSVAYVGGVAGYNNENKILYCYYDTTVISSSYDGKLNYTPTQAVGTNDRGTITGTTGKQTTEMTVEGFKTTLNDNVDSYIGTYEDMCYWTQETGSYPTLDFGSTPND